MRQILSLILLISGAAAGHAAPPDFDAEVAPLLAAHCLDCHSGMEPKGMLDLSRSAAALKGGETGPAVVAGNIEKSLLWERVAADEMPPKKPLANKEKQVLRRRKGCATAFTSRWRSRREPQAGLHPKSLEVPTGSLVTSGAVLDSAFAATAF